jgi:hypothetical protein
MADAWVAMVASIQKYSQIRVQWSFQDIDKIQNMAVGGNWVPWNFVAGLTERAGLKPLNP